MKHPKTGEVIDFGVRTPHGSFLVYAYEGQDDFNDFARVAHKLAGKAAPNCAAFCTTVFDSKRPIIAAPLWATPNTWAHEIIHVAHHFNIKPGGEKLSTFVDKAMMTIDSMLVKEVNRLARKRKAKQ